MFESNFFVAACCLPLTALAQNDLLFGASLEELTKVKISGPTKAKTSIKNAPAAVTIITREELRRFGIRTLGEALSLVSGIYTSSDRNYQFAGIRGFSRPGDYNTRLLLSINGHRFNDVNYDFASIDRTLPVAINDLERIEVSKGPVSAAWGSNALLGIINVITRKGPSYKNNELSLETGTNQSRGVGIRSGVTNESGTKDVAMGLTTWSSNGERFIAFNNVPQGGEVTPYVSRDRDSEESFQGYVSSRIDDFQINATGMNRSKINPTGAYDTAINNDLYSTRDRSLNFDVGYAPEKKEGQRLTPSARVYYDQYQYQGRSPYEDELSQVVLSRESDRHMRFGAETSITTAIGDESSVTLGTEAQRISKAQLYLYEEADPKKITLDVDRPFTLFSAYTEANLAMAKNFYILPGVRYDRYSFDVNQTSPRLAAVYNIDERSTVKMVYGQAFRAANNYERNYTSQSQGANAALNPEKLRSSELIFEHSFSPRWNTSLSAFRYSLSDIIEQSETSDGTLQFINNDKVTSSGVESQIVGKLENGILLRFALSFQDTTSSSTDKRSTNSPYVLSSLAVAIPTFDDLLFVHQKFATLVGKKLSAGEM